MAGTLELRELAGGTSRSRRRARGTSARAATGRPRWRTPTSSARSSTSKTPYDDEARAYTELAAGARVHREPRPYQTEALAAWRAQRGRGVVVLPTGSGKSHVAILAIDDAAAERARRRAHARPRAPVVRPARRRPSAARSASSAAASTTSSRSRSRRTTPRLPAHGAPRRALRARRLRRVPPPAERGVRARRARVPRSVSPRPHRDARARRRARAPSSTALIGPVVYRKDIVELSGDYLAEYDDRAGLDRALAGRAGRARRRAGDLPRLRDEPRHPHEPAVGLGRVRHALLAERGGPARDGRLPEAARARVRAPAKLDYLEHLLHAAPRATARSSSRRTTRPRTRSRAASSSRSSPTRRRCASGARSSPAWRRGPIGAVVTSKVLNEGVDVPDANVAVILSGSGIGARARPAARAHPAQAGRQARRALRARDRGDDRDVHERPAEGAQCLPLIS